MNEDRNEGLLIGEVPFMNISKLRTNHVKNPLGFAYSYVTFSWITESQHSDFQEASRVEVALDKDFTQVVSDSGKLTEIDNLCYSPELALKPRTRYFWRVTVWGNKGEYAISDTAWFETGKINEVWKAKWITPSLERETQPMIRHQFTLPENAVQARIYTCGLGIYHLELNGEKIGDEYLAPGFHAYDSWLQYQTYDITDMIIKGSKNVIGIMLGNGWYKGRFGFDGGHHDLYGDKFLFIGEIIVTCKDGSEIVIGTDEKWKNAPSPVIFSDIYDGEIYDATREIDEWTTPAYVDKDWDTVANAPVPEVPLQARLSLPIKIMEERKPVELIHTPNGEMVLDFGQVMTGWVRVKTTAARNTKLQLHYGEILQDGSFYRDNLRTAKAEYTYISDGSEREIQPYFTFYGFRYVKLTGFESINLEDFTGCVLYSEMEEIGNIETSNPLVNRLFQNAVWSQKGNFLDIPTDCPQRDERLGWTGDAQIFSSTACFNMYSPAFFKKFMFDLREEQKKLDGSVPYMVPTIKPPNDSGFVTGHGSSGWGDAATIIPWTLFTHYGDKNLLKSHFAIMKDWVDFIKRQDDETGSTRLWQKGFHFGDWLALDGEDPEGVIGGTDSYYVASAYYAHSASLVAKAAEVLGNPNLAAVYQSLADEVKDAITREYFTANARSAIQTQTSYILALQMDLVPSNYRERLIQDLKDKLGENNMHLSTGFVGTPYLCNVLSEYGASDYAYTLLLNEDYPSWLYAVKLGATTIWERWNSVLANGKISGTGMNSLNHYAYGSIAEWMYRYMCGINPVDDMPGFKKIRFSPMPDGRLSFAKATVKSASGLIESGWEFIEEDKLRFTFRVPFDTTADLQLPFTLEQDITLNGKPLSLYSFQVEELRGKICVSSLPMGNYEIITSAKNFLYPYSISSKFRELLENDSTRDKVYTIFPELEGNPFLKQHFEKLFKELNNQYITSDFVDDQRLKQLDKLLQEVRITPEYTLHA